MSTKKVIVRFCTAFVGALTFLVLGMTGAASAYSINVSGPGATVVAHGAYGDISASGPLSKVYVSGNYGGGGCGNYCQPDPCHTQCNPCQNNCHCEQNCDCEQNCEHKKCWYKHLNNKCDCDHDYEQSMHWYSKHW